MELLWAGVCGLGGLYRSGKLCDEHSGWKPVWVSAALGAAVVECHGDFDPVPLGQAGDCYGQDAAAELQEALFAEDFGTALGVCLRNVIVM